MISSKYQDSKTLLDSVVSQLARVEHFDGFSFVSTPLLFPDGGTVVVRVQKDMDAFFVTDWGLGYDESTLIDGQFYYSRIAPKVAESAGVEFDQHSFFVLRVSEQQLPGAIVAVANCVLEAVMQVHMKVNEYKARAASARLHERLTEVFRGAEVSRDVLFRGGSNHSWPFDSMVKKSSQIILFESVRKSHISVTSAYTKFNDVARAEDAPNRAAVIASKSGFGDYLPLLSQAAKIIERAANDEVYQSLARAS